MGAPGSIRFLILLLALAACAADAATLSVLSHNMNRFYDDVDDGNGAPRSTPARFAERARRAADAFAAGFGSPQVIALQEVENRRVLERIAAELRHRHGRRYRAFIADRNPSSDINLGYLVRADLRIAGVEALFADARHGPRALPLFSRPPLRLVACVAARCFDFVNLHLRSMRGIDSARYGARVRDKRRRQAETVAGWLNRRQHAADAPAVIVLGDFNALTPPDRHVDVAGILRGDPRNRLTRLAGRDLVEPDFVDASAAIADISRFSYRFRQRPQQLDYLLHNRGIGAHLEHIAFGEIDYRLSDHAGLAARFAW